MTALLRREAARVMPGLLALLLGIVVTAPASAAVKGDVNEDGVIDGADAVVLERVLAGAMTISDPDLGDVAPLGTSGNGTLGTEDLLILYRALQGDDLDGDGLATTDENAVGASPFLSDTDGDGYTDPNDPDPAIWTPAIPVLDPPISDPTHFNPYSVTGTADPFMGIVLYRDGVEHRTGMSNGSGLFSIPAELYDGANSVYAIAVAPGSSSPPSNTITLNYLNNRKRNWGNAGFGSETINNDMVWTPGDGSPYVVSGQLYVNAGATLTILAGTRVEFVPGTFHKLEVLGTLRVLGEVGSLVTFTSASVSPQAGNYQGIVLNGTNSPNNVIDFAVIEYARVGVGVDSSGGDITNSEIRHFASAGIELRNASGTVAVNHIHDGPDGIGVFALEGSTTLVHSNVIEFNGIGVVLLSYFGLVPPDLQIENNTIQNNDVGIHALNATTDNWDARGAPITGSILDNHINQNRIGIHLQAENSRSGVTHPDLVVTGNDLSSNTEFAVFLTDIDSAQNVEFDFRQNYWGTQVPSEIADLIGFNEEPGVSTIANERLADVPVDFSDFLDQYAGTVIPGTYYTMPLTAIAPDRYSFRPSLGETVAFSFTVLSAAATVRLDIYNETENDFTTTALRTFPSQSYGAGTHSIVWDGKDGNGNYLPDEAYTYLLTATAGGITSLYAPARYIGDNGTAGADERIAGTFIETWPLAFPNAFEYNPYRNEGFSFVGNLIGRPMRWDMYVGGLLHNVFTGLPIAVENPKTLHWDGRRNFGGMHPDPQFIKLDLPYGMRPNAVIVQGRAPTVTGVVGIEVESDPFLIVPSFGQRSTIRYQLDQSADVEIKILPPGSFWPTNPDAVTLQPADGTPEPANTPLELEVSGVDANGNLILDQNGTYTFTIEATSTATGASSLYRGALQVRR